MMINESLNTPRTSSLRPEPFQWLSDSRFCPLLLCDSKFSVNFVASTQPILTVMIPLQVLGDVKWCHKSAHVALERDLWQLCRLMGECFI